jgi:hypothetical protein
MIFINMSQNRVPITRLNKFFSEEDFNLEIEMGMEWQMGDMNFTVVLYRVDRQRTNNDDVYGEAMSEGIQFLAPIEVKGLVKIDAPTNSDYGSSKLSQLEPGNMTFSVYQSHLDQLAIEISLGDYLAYYETEDRVRYYSVVNDGRVTSDLKHTYGGYKKYYRTIIATPVTNDEFNGL